MKLRIAFMLLTLSLLGCVAHLAAQEANDDAQSLENLRVQLSNVQDQEAELKIRLDQVNFDSKPENIERYFNGVGSTRPEELRESRRRQLQTEKDRVITKLDQLSASRSRLEAAVARAQAELYQQQSAAGMAILQNGQHRSAYLLTAMRVLVGIGLLLVFLGGLASLLVIRRRRRTVVRLGGIFDEPW
jgi:hypothetical protein